MYSRWDRIKTILVVLAVGWAMFHFSSRNKDSLKYKSGKVKRTGEVVNNKNNGIWTWYFENGNPQLTGTFIDGKREGTWKTYDSLGNLIMESNYKNNLLNGKLILYFEDSIVVKEFKNEVLMGSFTEK